MTDEQLFPLSPMVGKWLTQSPLLAKCRGDSWNSVWRLGLPTRERDCHLVTQKYKQSSQESLACVPLKFEVLEKGEAGS